MLAWFQQLLVGPAPMYHALCNTVSNLDDWGILANILQFYQYNEEIGTTYTEIDVLQAKVDAFCHACFLAQSHIKAVQAHKQVEYLEGLALGYPTCSVGRVWKKRVSQVTDLVLKEGFQPNGRGDVTGTQARINQGKNWEPGQGYVEVAELGFALESQIVPRVVDKRCSLLL